MKKKFWLMLGEEDPLKKPDIFEPLEMVQFQLAAHTPSINTSSHETCVERMPIEPSEA